MTEKKTTLIGPEYLALASKFMVIKHSFFWMENYFKTKIYRKSSENFVFFALFAFVKMLITRWEMVFSHGKCNHAYKEAECLPQNPSILEIKALFTVGTIVVVSRRAKPKLANV